MIKKIKHCFCQSYYNDENKLIDCTCGKCEPKNQTNNWEEVDKRFDTIECPLIPEYHDDRECCSAIKEECRKNLHTELTNLLKTVAEARPKKKGLICTRPEGSYINHQRYGFDQAIGQWESNISEKYPEFKELVKGK